eukprot:9664989-Lingulodinium_polyedra.AAC.1
MPRHASCNANLSETINTGTVSDAPCPWVPSQSSKWIWLGGHSAAAPPLGLALVSVVVSATAGGCGANLSP